MTVALLSIGTELTRGELVDTNAAWLAEQLTTLGFEVREQATVDDDVGRIGAALERLAAAARVVVCTGGLGPTSDDLTCEAVAAHLGRPLERHGFVLDRIRARYAARGQVMPVANERQADFPRGAKLIDNSVGTAPGFEVALGQARCFFLPGVPREMKHLFVEHLRPEVAPLAQRTTHQVHLRTFGLPESQVATLLADFEAAYPDVTVGYRASFPEIEVKILARGEHAAAAEGRAKLVAAEARAALGDIVYGERADRFPAVVGQALRDRGLLLAVAESCTGGLIGAMLTEAPGSSEFLLFDGVVYANSAKERVLGVPNETLRCHGAVSGETAAAMAEGAQRAVDANLAVSVTGVAGPGGGTEDKPVGTVWFGLARDDAPTLTFRRRFSGDRDQVRGRAAHFALDLVRRAATGDRVPSSESA